MEASIISFRAVRICYLLFIIILAVGCHPSGQKRNDATTVESEHFRFLAPLDLKREFSKEHITRLHDVLTASILPILSGQDREEVLDVIHYFEKIKEETPNYFEAPENCIRFLNTLMQLHVMTAKHNPDNFELNLNVASYYMQNAFVMEDLAKSDSERLLIERFKASGMEAANHLVENFPDHAMSYAQLAHSLYITGGDKQKVAGLLKHCLDLDQKSDYCRDFLDTLERE